MGEKLKVFLQSDIERQSLVFVLKRPDGVNIMIEGGRRGYSTGKVSIP